MKLRNLYQTPTAETYQLSLEQLIAVSPNNAPSYSGGLGAEQDWDSID
jgi:hypothetical protein